MMLPLNSHRWRTLETFCHAPGVPGGIEVRDRFKTSRKYALALMEYLDKQGITKRKGDERVLGNKS